MGYYVIAVGGTGNKILESVVYGACADAFYTLEDKRHTPLPAIHLLSVDVDASCGNTTRAKQAAEHYEKVRALFPEEAPPRRGFHTQLRLERWNMNLSKRATSVERMVQNHKQEQILANTLFDRTEASLEYSEGFRGHPDLGVLFFADLLSELPAAAASGQPDEMLRFMGRMQEEMDRGERVKVILCGSIFGGTGASGIPSISQHLRRYFARYSSLFELGSVLMLPYYKVPASSQSEEMEIVVKSSTFLDKARTALQYYGMESMIREGEEDEDGIYDAVYLLGLPPEAFVTTRIYSTGSQSQENDAHMLEWLAMRCIARFFRTGFRGEDSHNIDCYYYQLHDRAFSWASFDEEAQGYRLGFGGLLKAATAFFAECYPTLRAQLFGSRRGSGNLVNYYAAWFYRAHRLSGMEKARLERDLDALYHCLAFYCNWMIQVVRTLPPTLRQDQETERRFAEAAQGYDKLLERHVLLKEREARPPQALLPAQQAAHQALREEYNGMLARQQELLALLGGSRWLEILKDARLARREAVARQEEALSALRERIAAWEGTDSHLVQEGVLRQERERMAAMERVAETLRAQGRKVGEDIEAAIRENLLSQPGEAPPDQEGPLPPNSLFDPQLLGALHELLTLYGLPAPQRDARRMDALAQALQQGIAQLMIRPTPDPVDMPRLIAGVAGGEAQGKSPQAMLSGFWAALLAASMEESSL